jgi:hypothetical protein
MARNERIPLMKHIEVLRPGRRLICLLNFDKVSDQLILGLDTQFSSDIKEALFRVLKESLKQDDKIDLFLYTRGGDINSVWPIVSLLQEFDKDFAVLVPFRCHSAGTLLSLGANKIIMGPISELGPVDPSVGNVFNPADPNNPQNKLPISVEDVQAYCEFISTQFSEGKVRRRSLKWLLFFSKPIMELVNRTHPLAIGNVHRSLLQIKQLAKNLLNLHPLNHKDVKEIVHTLTTSFYSHLHAINRLEALEIIGPEKIEFASPELSNALDCLLREYEDNFRLRKPFLVNGFMGNDTEKEARFIGGTVESTDWSYLLESKYAFKQYSIMPPNLNIQIPLEPNTPAPLIPGLSTQIEWRLITQSWIHNKEPQGVTT